MLDHLLHWRILKALHTASTIPITFSTALYALKYRANLQPGEVSYILLNALRDGY